MANLNVFALRNSDLNGFLFAEVGPEANGMTLTVVSLLARAGTDPWSEADRLSKLPAAEAASWLEAAIASTLSKPAQHADTDAIALRLVALLPRRDRASA